VKRHRQVWVKVNAHVDEGIAPLVKALSSFPHVRTWESCRGQPGRRLPHVYFSAGFDGQEQTIPFVAWLAPRLVAEMRDQAYLSLEWATRETPLGVIEARRGRILAVARALRKLAREYHGSVRQPRPNERVCS
jgi:hypothetical protein